MKQLSDLTFEDAKIIITILRPYDSIETINKYFVIRDDNDYLVIRTDTYMVEEVWFYKKSYNQLSDTVFHINYAKANINYDHIYLAYHKLIEMGYILQSLKDK